MKIMADLVALIWSYLKSVLPGIGATGYRFVWGNAFAGF